MKCVVLSFAISTLSWLMYGGLGPASCAAEEAGQQSLTLEAKDTVYFREEGGELRQVLHVTVKGNWDKRGIFRIDAGGKAFEVDAEQVPRDDDHYVIGVSPVTAETPVSVELAAGGRRPRHRSRCSPIGNGGSTSC